MEGYDLGKRLYDVGDMVRISTQCDLYDGKEHEVVRVYKLLNRWFYVLDIDGWLTSFSNMTLEPADNIESYNHDTQSLMKLVFEEGRVLWR